METKPRIQRPQMTLRPEMDEELEALSDASGLPKVEIVARAVKAYAPRLLEVARILNPTHEESAAQQAGAA